MVLPVAKAWPSFWMVTSNGKFHGTIAPTTPTGSRQTLRVVFWPVRDTKASPRSVSHAYSSISRTGNLRASSSGASSCGPKVIARGVPTSRMSSSRSSSFSFSNASCSCNRHRLRNSLSVDQSVSSKARRAASMARCMSAFDASATSPSHLFGGRVDVGERAGLAVDELAVDHHLRLESEPWAVSAISLALVSCCAAESTAAQSAERGDPSSTASSDEVQQGAVPG